MKMSAKKLGLASAVAVALSSSAAMADPLFFSQSSGWEDDPDNPTWTLDPQAGFTGLIFSNESLNGAPANTFDDMSWCSPDDVPGGNGNCSAINITSFSSDDGSSPLRLQNDFTTDLTATEWNEGDWWVIDTLTQSNNVLGVPTDSSLPDPLWIADTVANLRIYSDSPREDVIFADLDSRLTIDFWESLNVTNNNCPGLNPVGTVCDDRYRVSISDFAPLTFFNDGQLYSLSFQLLFDDNTETSVDLDEFGQPRLNVWTGETEQSFISVAMSWNAIPAPGALALMSFGALGLGVFARRRRTTA